MKGKPGARFTVNRDNNKKYRFYLHCAWSLPQMSGRS